MFSWQWIIRGLIRQHRCLGWSPPFLFTYNETEFLKALLLICTVKPVWSGHSKRRPKVMVFNTYYRLMQVKSIAEWSNRSILQYFRPSLSYHLSLRCLFCPFLSGSLRQVLLYYFAVVLNGCISSPIFFLYLLFLLYIVISLSIKELYFYDMLFTIK